MEVQGVSRRLKGTDASCDPAKLGEAKTLLTWKAVPAETGGEGAGADGEGSRMELAVDEEALEALSKVDSKVRRSCSPTAKVSPKLARTVVFSLLRCRRCFRRK